MQEPADGVLHRAAAQRGRGRDRVLCVPKVRAQLLREQLAAPLRLSLLAFLVHQCDSLPSKKQNLFLKPLLLK